MDTFKSVNDLAVAGVSEFAVRSFDGFTLIVVGSFDLCYYHDIALKFTDVQHIFARLSPVGIRANHTA